MSTESICRYITIETEEQAEAVLTLLQELDKGRQSGEEKGWFTLEEVEASLALSHK